MLRKANIPSSESQFTRDDKYIILLLYGCRSSVTNICPTHVVHIGWRRFEYIVRLSSRRSQSLMLMSVLPFDYTSHEFHYDFDRCAFFVFNCYQLTWSTVVAVIARHLPSYLPSYLTFAFILCVRQKRGGHIIIITMYGAQHSSSGGRRCIGFVNQAHDKRSHELLFH